MRRRPKVPNPGAWIPFLSTLLILLLASGCAPLAPRETGSATAPTPRQVAALGIPDGVRDVRWGGSIIGIKNMRHNTEIEIVSYPISSQGEPDTGEAPQGRFIAVQAGYLEPLNYAPGRRVTVQGTLEKTRLGRVGEADYLFPVVEISTIRLWPKPDTGNRLGPVFNFGFGVGSGGRTSGGVGVGIGF